MLKTLQDDFASRKTWIARQASALFPIHFMSTENDLLISILNYWTLKNNIPEEAINITLKIYDHSGQLYRTVAPKRVLLSNLFSIRKYVERVPFYGMVEVIVKSKWNLKFTFPAITAFFKAGDLFSAVHSAGRLKSAEEDQTPTETLETNWSCIFREDITPFFHYVNGPKADVAEIIVTLHNADGSLVVEKNIEERLRGYQSKLYLVRDIFPLVELTSPSENRSNMFVSVKCKNDMVHRRMIVGNFHERLGHLEVTHSFPWQKAEDYCPAPSEEACVASFLACYTIEDLSLEVVIFPTNCESSYRHEVYLQNKAKPNLVLTDSQLDIRNGSGKFNLADDCQFLVAKLYGKVPSRLNASFRYTLKHQNTGFCTDIATGAKSSVYPPKYTHWGSALIGGGYECVIMIRNNSHNGDSKSGSGTLSVYGLREVLKIPVQLDPESMTPIKISEAIGPLMVGDQSKPRIITWLMKLDCPSAETIWVAYNRTNGCVLGEHGF